MATNIFFGGDMSCKYKQKKEIVYSNLDWLMERTRSKRTVLFGMTGFGNSALKVLFNNPMTKLLAVFTPPKPDGPFPYYKCNQIVNEVKKFGVKVYEGLNLKDKKVFKIINNLKVDFMVVASFNQIIPLEIIKLSRFGVINIHPSLLPQYRGATPTRWVLLNKEKETGVTIHFIEDEKIDSGRIILQKRTLIKKNDDEGKLRYKLAKISEEALEEAIKILFVLEKKDFEAQNNEEASYYPKLSTGEFNRKMIIEFQKKTERIKAE